MPILLCYTKLIRKGIDASYYYEGYNVFKTEDLGQV